MGEQRESRFKTPLYLFPASEEEGRVKIKVRRKGFQRWPTRRELLEASGQTEHGSSRAPSVDEATEAELGVQAVDRSRVCC